MKTASRFVEQSIQENVGCRQIEREFIARGLRSADAARGAGSYVNADAVVGRLEQMLKSAKAKAVK